MSDDPILAGILRRFLEGHSGGNGYQAETEMADGTVELVLDAAVELSGAERAAVTRIWDAQTTAP